jgi:photosystem II stability/assembly factor-like uncharacterized protein
MATPSGFTVASADFVSADEGWVTAYSPTAGEDPYSHSILRTRDGGVHWEGVYGPDPDLSLGPVCFLDDQTGWVVAMESRRESLDSLLHFDYYVLRTIDSGTTWTKTAVALDFGLLYLNDIVFADPSRGFIVGSGRKGIGAVIFRTADGGATWTPCDAEGAEWSLDGIQAASFSDGQKGWAVAGWESGAGEGSAILHTEDGGLPWERQYGYETETPTGDHLWYRGADFVDAEHGWVVGDGGLLLRTTDRGETWQELEAPAGTNLRAVDFLDPLEGWVAGMGGYVLHTTDGGDTWVREAVATTANLSAIEVFDQAHGVALTVADSGEGTLLSLGEGPVFTDIASSPYREAVEGLYADGLVGGYEGAGGLEFQPDYPVWRAQIAKMIVGALDLAVTEDLTSPFTDLGEDIPYDLYPHQFVAAAYAAGITTGLTPTTFGPFVDATRAQVVTMVVRAARSLDSGRLAAPPAGYTGTPGDFSSAHAESMAWAEYNGLLEGLVGFGPGWDPWQKATRGEVAQILWTLMRS